MSLTRHPVSSPMCRKMKKQESENPILDGALNLIESVAPRALTDPDEALSNLVEELGWIEIEKNEDLSIPQIKALQDFEAFDGLNFIQIKKKLSESSVREGPTTEVIAIDSLIPLLNEVGLSATFIWLSDDEKEAQLDDDLPDYFKQ